MFNDLGSALSIPSWEQIKRNYEQQFENFNKRKDMTPREVLIDRQNQCRAEINRLYLKITTQEAILETLEDAIDALDEAETEAFNKDRG